MNKRHIVDFPTCELCGSPDPMRCPVCFGYYCHECTMNINMERDECEHERFVPIKGDEWKSALEQKYQ